MRVAQKLYEGINLNKETSGLITYMRTDGVQISQEAITNIREFISNEYGKTLFPKVQDIINQRLLTPKKLTKQLDQQTLLIHQN